MFFFLGGKKASCDYGLTARTLKNIRLKERDIPSTLLLTLEQHQLDTSAIGYLLQHGDINFSASETRLDSCRRYQIEGDYKDKHLVIKVANCAKTAHFQDIDINP